MNRQEKQDIVKDLKHYFNTSAGSFIVNYRGLSVADLQKLRKKLREQGAQMHVTKARLMKLAAQDMKMLEELDEHFKDQIALVFADNKPFVVAKVLQETAKENTKLTIIAGCVEDRCFDQEGVKVLATLPSREVILAQFAGLLSASTAHFAQLLDGKLFEFVLLLKALEQKKQQ